MRIFKARSCVFVNQKRYWWSMFTKWLWHTSYQALSRIFRNFKSPTRPTIQRSVLRTPQVVFIHGAAKVSNKIRKVRKDLRPKRGPPGKAAPWISPNAIWTLASWLLISSHQFKVETLMSTRGSAEAEEPIEGCSTLGRSKAINSW